mmetsp:Transcript_9537/g.21236  ORF Transcript_9537/g.21236 Transcript_9537/m.21236 type:complete len:253 (+) Transcript_9537:1142-1900(+)
MQRDEGQHLPDGQLLRRFLISRRCWTGRPCGRHRAKVDRAHRELSHRLAVIAKKDKIVLRMDKKAHRLYGQDLRKGELHMHQRLWDRIPVCQHQALLDVNHQAHSVSTNEGGVTLLVALKEVRRVFVGNPSGHSAQHGLNSSDRWVPARRIPREILNSIFLLGISGGSLCFDAGRRLGLDLRCSILDRFWSAGRRCNESLTSPRVRPLRGKAPHAQGPEGTLHSHRGSLLAALIGRRIEPGHVEGLPICHAS